eukprot:CAMPEP_0113649434 /NCGR_PEP_ID=MMETSP0017_2-20120614/26263_1 /TAXON_ID=2856 /ORGANISM="Cylindrotheca closterium" /LENGTH=59 /DNA_ID=CAMNT_0000561799 /DNA_START=1011 /DNA_END=1187 /DNA_ORIENTATION=+ /assembly_acc=CAM_ASM_000147
MEYGRDIQKLQESAKQSSPSPTYNLYRTEKEVDPLRESATQVDSNARTSFEEAFIVQTN